MRKRGIGALLLAALCLVMAQPVRVATASATADTLTVYLNGQMVRMDLDDYLTCVVAAEMPASYAMEALKAQAVAARTRVAYGGCLSHRGANVCADSKCCQGYLDEAGQNKRWGNDADFYRARIREAVESTHGVLMLYGGEPIEVLYHAVSGGVTEDVEAVYANALPHLRSVESPGEEHAKGFETVSTFTNERLREVFVEVLSKDGILIEVLARSETGRVMLIRVGNETMSGRAFRSALGLSSTNFAIESDDDGLIITQRGYGHGVGMSQAGANAMAETGATYDEILLHYYTGVTLSPVQTASGH